MVLWGEVEGSKRCGINYVPVGLCNTSHLEIQDSNLIFTINRPIGSFRVNTQYNTLLVIFIYYTYNCNVRVYVNKLLRNGCTDSSKISSMRLR